MRLNTHIPQNMTRVHKKTGSILRFNPLKFIQFDPTSVSLRAMHGILIKTFLCHIPTAITSLAIRRFPISFPSRRSTRRTCTEDEGRKGRKKERQATPWLPAGSLIRRVAWLARNTGQVQPHFPSPRRRRRRRRRRQRRRRRRR